MRTTRAVLLTTALVILAAVLVPDTGAYQSNRYRQVVYQPPPTASPLNPSVVPLSDQRHRKYSVLKSLSTDYSASSSYDYYSSSSSSSNGYDLNGRRVYQQRRRNGRQRSSQQDSSNNGRQRLGRNRRRKVIL